MKQILLGFSILSAVVFSAACTGAPAPPQEQQSQQQSALDSSRTQSSKDPNRRLKIGFAMDTLKEERWVRDKEAFEKHCQEIKVDCVVTVANNVAEKQSNDVENLLTQGVDALVIVPNNATQAASMVEKAKAQGVPVISYDRLINSDKIDLYVSHQVPIIGRRIAEYALKNVPKGNYLMVYGASTDNNAVIMKKEQLAVLQPAIDRGDIKIVADQFITDWKPDLALNFTENWLTKTNDNIQAVIVSNDGMAGGVVSALDKRKLTGKILVTGQDAELAALKRIAEGKQTMTIYKPIIPLAGTALELAVDLANKKPLSGTTMFKNEVIGKEIPAVLLEVQVVDKDNLMTTVIRDGYAKYEDVYAGVPADQRPKQ